jgi:hypothetical protein
MLWLDIFLRGGRRAAESGGAARGGAARHVSRASDVVFGSKASRPPGRAPGAETRAPRRRRACLPRGHAPRAAAAADTRRRRQRARSRAWEQLRPETPAPQLRAARRTPHAARAHLGGGEEEEGGKAEGGGGGGEAGSGRPARRRAAFRRQQERGRPATRGPQRLRLPTVHPRRREEPARARPGAACWRTLRDARRAKACADVPHIHADFALTQKARANTAWRSRCSGSEAAPAKRAR